MGRRALLLLALAAGPAQAAEPGPAPAAAGELRVGVYLPGFQSSQVNKRVELGAELAAHLALRLSRPPGSVSARVYATAESLENDAAKLTLAVVEAPYAAARLHLLTPLCVAPSADGREETKLVIMAPPGGPVQEVSDLRRHRLAYAQVAYDEQGFLGNFVFRGDLQLGREHLEPARDAASALSLVSLRKAEAVLLYEDDIPTGQAAGLRVIYETSPLPRPALVVYDKNQDEQRVMTLREVMGGFRGQAYALVRSCRPTTADRYLALRAQLGRKSPRLPPLLELDSKADEELRLPPSRGAPPQAPQLRLYLPSLPAKP